MSSNTTTTPQVATGARTAGPRTTVRPARLRGLAVVAAGLVLTLGGAAIVHHVGHTDDSWSGEITAELVAAVLGYLVAFGLGWWRPQRSRSAELTAERTGLVLALLGALLVPICFWNPMPLTFAASALLLLRWGRLAGGGSVGTSGRRRLGSAVTVLSVAVIAVQVVVFVVHVVSSSTN